MASLKAEKPVGTQLFGQATKASDATVKAPASKSGAKKAAQKPQEPKKKGKGSKGGKAAAKN